VESGVRDLQDIKPASHIITNKKVFSLITRDRLLGKHILDIGAGRGFMAQQIGHYIAERGGNPKHILTACDLFPEYFEYDAIECNKFDFANSLPYDDCSYDIVYAIEVIEHFENPVDFIREAYRILRRGGTFIITTPNVLNINSRLSYLMHGFFVLFGPVSFDKNDSVGLLGHIMPLSYYYLDYFMRKEGFVEVELHIDRIKKSALFYYLLLFPIIRFSSSLKKIKIRKKNAKLFLETEKQIKIMNSFKMLCSRSCILVGHK